MIIFKKNTTTHYKASPPKSQISLGILEFIL